MQSQRDVVLVVASLTGQSSLSPPEIARARGDGLVFKQDAHGGCHCFFYFFSFRFSLRTFRAPGSISTGASRGSPILAPNGQNNAILHGGRLLDRRR